MFGFGWYRLYRKCKDLLDRAILDLQNLTEQHKQLSKDYEELSEKYIVLLEHHYRGDSSNNSHFDGTFN